MDALVYALVGALTGILTERGLRRWFQQAATSYWIPLITAVALAATHAYLIPYYEANRFEYRIRHEDPALAVIAAAAPKEYQTYLQRARQHVLEGKNEIRLMMDKLNFLNTLFARAAPIASNQSVYDAYRVSLAVDQALFKVAPSLVLYLEFSNKFDTQPSPTLLVMAAGKDWLQAAIATKEAVILSAVTSPQAPITNAEKQRAQQLLTATINELSVLYGQDTIAAINQDPENPQLDTKRAATIVMLFAQKILDHGVDDTAIVYKFLLSGKTR